jgi:hypothetical protein
MSGTVICGAWGMSVRLVWLRLGRSSAFFAGRGSSPVEVWSSRSWLARSGSPDGVATGGRAASLGRSSAASGARPASVVRSAGSPVAGCCALGRSVPRATSCRSCRLVPSAVSAAGSPALSCSGLRQSVLSAAGGTACGAGCSLSRPGWATGDRSAPSSRASAGGVGSAAGASPEDGACACQNSACSPGRLTPEAKARLPEVRVGGRSSWGVAGGRSNSAGTSAAGVGGAAKAAGIWTGASASCEMLRGLVRRQGFAARRVGSPATRTSPGSGSGRGAGVDSRARTGSCSGDLGAGRRSASAGSYAAGAW